MKTSNTKRYLPQWADCQTGDIFANDYAEKSHNR